MNIENTINSVQFELAGGSWNRQNNRMFELDRALKSAISIELPKKRFGFINTLRYKS